MRGADRGSRLGPGREDFGGGDGLGPGGKGLQGGCEGTRTGGRSVGASERSSLGKGALGSGLWRRKICGSSRLCSIGEGVVSGSGLCPVVKKSLWGALPYRGGVPVGSRGTNGTQSGPRRGTPWMKP
ncbi:hypothetical protein Nmel_018854 [Mimus melanotis]